MSSVSPDSSASNIPVYTGGVVLSPVLLIEQLAKLSMSEQTIKEITCEYYRACIASSSAAVVAVRSQAGSVNQSLISVTSNGGTNGFVGSVGKCYLRAVKKEERLAVYGKLGAEPTIRQLLQLPRRLFFSDSVLKKIRVKCGFGGTHHLAEDGQYDFLELMRLMSYNVQWISMTLGARVLVTDKREKPREVAQVALDDKLGTKVVSSEGVEAGVSELLNEDTEVVVDTVNVGVRISTLLSLPMTAFRPRSELLGYGVGLSKRDGVVSLRRQGGVVTWLTFVTHYANKTSRVFPVGSLGAALKFGADLEWSGIWSWPEDPIIGTAVTEVIQMRVDGRMDSIAVGAYFEHMGKKEGIALSGKKSVRMEIENSGSVETFAYDVFPGDEFECDGSYILIGGSYQVAGWTVDASQVRIGAKLLSKVKCLTSGRLVLMPVGCEFSRASSNVDSMCREYADTKLEVFWSHTEHSVAVEEMSDCQNLDDGSSSYGVLVKKKAPFQVLTTPWLGATYVAADKSVKLKMGCFSGYGVSGVLHRGYYNASVLGLVVSAKHDGNVRFLGVADAYDWDCSYDSDLSVIGGFGYAGKGGDCCSCSSFD